MTRIWWLAMAELRQRARDRIGLFWMLGFPLLMALLFASLGASSRPGRVELVASDAAALAPLVEQLSASGHYTFVRYSDKTAEALVRQGRAKLALLGDASAPYVLSDPRHAAAAHGVATALVTPPPSRPPPPVMYTQPATAMSLTFAAALLWGLLAASATFAVALVEERQRGTYARLRVSPVTRLELLLSKGLAAMLTQALITVTLAGVGWLGFGLGIAQPLTLILSLALVSLALLGVTALVASLGSTTQAVAGAGWAVNIVFAMFGGAMVPRHAMPTWMAQASMLSPVRWALELLDNAIWQARPLTEMLTPIFALTATSVIGLALGYLRLWQRDAQ